MFAGDDPGCGNAEEITKRQNILGIQFDKNARSLSFNYQDRNCASANFHQTFHKMLGFRFEAGFGWKN